MLIVFQMSIRCVDIMWSASSPGLGRLMSAVRSGEVESVRNILSHHRDIQLDQRDKHGKYPIHYAVLTNNVKITELILECGAGVNQLSYAVYHRQR